MSESVSPQVQRQTLVCLLGAQAIVIAPLFLHLPLWLGLIWLLAVTIRLQVYRGVWHYPGNFVKALLGLLPIAGLVLQYGISMGVEPMVGLLLSAFMLKLVEARQRRDFLLIIFIGFVAVAAQFLFSQTILASLYGLFSCIALIVAWHSCFITRQYTAGSHFKYSSGLVLQAAPLMVLLFLLLPRIGPLWAVPAMQSTGATGFSDSMAPGDIAQLSLSSAVAFRVSFEGREPAKSQMYWRGLVLDRFDGRRWHASENDYGRSRSFEDASEAEPTGDTLTYRVMLEAHQQNWLFFLLTPVDMETGVAATYTARDLLKTRRPVDNRIQYQVTSDLSTSRAATGLSKWVRERNLQLPELPANPRTAQLVDSWQGSSPREMVNAALRLFQQQFEYTLQPPPLGSNSIDEFLFITRKGFCEHFASSFVYLMRAAGVPARVVVGYQGGERSEVEEYWLVRQSSAHAWAEVWLEGQGWIRVDPTSVVAPNRIEQNLSEALGADELYLAGGESLLGAQNWPWLRTLRHRWDALGYAWHLAVLSYDSESQKGVLKRLLGGVDPWRIGLAILLGGAVLLGLYGLAFWYRNRAPAVAPEIRLLRKAEGYLGVPRAPDEPPGQWAERVAGLYPKRARAARQVARLFEAAVYADRREYGVKLQQAVKALSKS